MVVILVVTLLSAPAVGRYRNAALKVCHHPRTALPTLRCARSSSSNAPAPLLCFRLVLRRHALGVPPGQPFSSCRTAHTPETVAAFARRHACVQLLWRADSSVSMRHALPSA